MILRNETKSKKNDKNCVRKIDIVIGIHGKQEKRIETTIMMRPYHFAIRI